MGKYLRVYQDFSGGLSEAANDMIADNQLVEAKNIMPGDGCGIARACGAEPAFPPVPVSGQINSVRRMLRFYTAAGVEKLLAFVHHPPDRQDVYCFDRATQSWSLLSSGELSVLDHFIMGGKLYWLNGSKLRVYDGSTLSNGALTPAQEPATTAELAVWAKVEKAVSVAIRGQRVFYGTAQGEVIFSQIGSPTAVQPTDLINLTGAAEPMVTAIHEFNDGLLLFQKDGISYLQGWDLEQGSDVRLTRLNVEAGTQWKDTVQTMNNSVLYLAADCLCRLSLTANGEAVLSRDISRRRIGKRLNRGEKGLAFARVRDGIYYLELAFAESNGTLRHEEYRYLAESESFFGPFTQESLCYQTDLNGDGALYLGGYSGYILRYDENCRHYFNTRRGLELPIAVLARSKSYDVAGNFARELRLHLAEAAAKQYLQERSCYRLKLLADHERSGMEWQIDCDDSLVYGEGQLGVACWGWQDTVIRELPVRSRCQRLQFVISDDSMDQPLLFYGLALVFRKKRIKGSRRGVSEQ